MAGKGSRPSPWLARVSWLGLVGMSCGTTGSGSGANEASGPPGHQERTVAGRSPGVRLHVVDTGGASGPDEPVVFVHGFAASSRLWEHQLAHVRGQGRRAVALDLRGHGQSTAPTDGNYAIGVMADDSAAVVDTLGLRRFVLVAHSMGAAIAGEYAGANPDRAGRS